MDSYTSIFKKKILPQLARMVIDIERIQKNISYKENNPRTTAKKILSYKRDPLESILEQLVVTEEVLLMQQTLIPTILNKQKRAFYLSTFSSIYISLAMECIKEAYFEFEDSISLINVLPLKD